MTYTIGTMFSGGGGVDIGAMDAGASQMQFNAGVRFQIIDIIQGLILFFVSADVIIRKILGSRAVDEDKVQLSSGWGS